ncbi:MAG: M23 family metallopeptidase [Acidobacteriota bacterium]|nr:M23 family metallopeptidase [Acidobacteriota bacterium]
MAKDNQNRWKRPLSRVGLVTTLVAATSCSSPSGPTPGSGTGDNSSGVNCAVFSDSASSAYTLTFATGQRVYVSRTFEHYLAANGGVGVYAIDFDVPMRTPVHAARGGMVVAVEQRFSDDDHANFHENWVMVRHADGTVGRYIHLARNGALVAVGDEVRQGQRLGLSGNSGASNGPHLHFDVQTCGPNLPPGYNTMPCGMTVPVSFRNTAPHSCGLTPRQSYTAAAFTPDP